MAVWNTGYIIRNKTRRNKNEKDAFILPFFCYLSQQWDAPRLKEAENEPTN